MKNNNNTIVIMAILFGVNWILFIGLFLNVGEVKKDIKEIQPVTINYQEIVSEVSENEKEQNFLDSLKQEINKYPFRFPELILTQAIFESGNFSSRLFREQNNLFGMKVPNKRLTTGVRGKNGFLQFETWQSSVLDRFIFECTYLSKFKDRESYIEYLNKNYGTNINYFK